ncbi:MAG: Hpt domain-containing protein [Rhodospirillaceae bacterium]|nr:Hpt domain-containing protein [Rhodospirillaceae bacterium]
MSDDSEIITPPTNLQSKVQKGGPGAVDLDAIERAEQVIANLADDYINWAKEDLVKLEDAYKKLKEGKGDQKELLQGVFNVAHDMKGQGGSFGFELMTAVGDKLCRLVEKLDKVGPKEIEKIRIYVDAMQVIISRSLKGDGGSEGKQLLMGLEVMVQKS